MLIINKSDLVHFCGIGGIGMSALAKIMAQEGYNVQGSDLSVLSCFDDTNIVVFSDQKADNLKNVKYFVYSTAIKNTNPEFEYAQKNGIKILHRSDILEYIMRNKYGIVISGTHGKTTTTTLLADLFVRMSVPTSAIIGGIAKITENNCIVNDSNYIIVEGDESDRSFLKGNKKISIVTNVDIDHLENYNQDVDFLFSSFAQFINNTDPDGICILCKDSKMLTQYVKPLLTHKNIVWYSLEADMEDVVYAKNISNNAEYTEFDVVFEDQTLKNVQVPLFGMHNVSNTLAVLIVAKYLKFDLSNVRQALKLFAGVKRRFDIIGNFEGAIVIDDYAHHPIEIKATLAAVRARYGKNARIIAILEPHRYSRVSKLLNEFGDSLNEANIKIVTDIYCAFEDISQYGDLSYLTLADIISVASGDKVYTIKDLEDVAPFLKDIIKPDDIIIFLGAGKASQYARKIAE